MEKMKENFEEIPQSCDENSNLKSKILQLEKENANFVDELQKLVNEIQLYMHKKDFTEEGSPTGTTTKIVTSAPKQRKIRLTLNNDTTRSTG